MENNPDSKSCTAQRDFTDDAGKSHKQGETVTGLTQSEISRRIQSGELKQQPA